MPSLAKLFDYIRYWNTMQKIEEDKQKLYHDAHKKGVQFVIDNPESFGLKIMNIDELRDSNKNKTP